MEPKNYAIIALLAIGLLLAGCSAPALPGTAPAQPAPTCQPFNACCAVCGTTLSCFNTTACLAQNLTPAQWPAGITGIVYNQTPTYAMPYPSVNLTPPIVNTSIPVCISVGCPANCTGNNSYMNCTMNGTAQVCNPVLGC